MHGVIPPLQHETHVHQGVMYDHPANPGLSLRVHEALQRRLYLLIPPNLLNARLSTEPPQKSILPARWTLSKPVQ